jgi:hypothetical protein
LSYGQTGRAERKRGLGRKVQRRERERESERVRERPRETETEEEMRPLTKSRLASGSRRTKRRPADTPFIIAVKCFSYPFLFWGGRKGGREGGREGGGKGGSEGVSA